MILFDVWCGFDNLRRFRRFFFINWTKSRAVISWKHAVILIEHFLDIAWVIFLMFFCPLDFVLFHFSLMELGQVYWKVSIFNCLFKQWSKAFKCGFLSLKRFIQLFKKAFIRRKNILKAGDKFMWFFKIFFIKFGLLFGDFSCSDFESSFIKFPELFLLQTFILLVLDSFINWKQVVFAQIWWASGIDQVFANEVEGWRELVFEYCKVGVKGLLNFSRVGFGYILKWNLLGQSDEFFLWDKFRVGNMIVILFDASIAAGGFFPWAMLWEAEDRNFFIVFALMHYFIGIISE